MRSMISQHTFRKFIKISITGLALVAIGVSQISISRHDSYHERGAQNQDMSTWISQYMGEGMIRFDDTVWYNESPLGGCQTLPVAFSLFDPTAKDTDKYIARNERISKDILTVFYTYIGDFYLDFGRIGAVFAIIVLSIATGALLKVKHKSISIFRLIPLCWIFILITIGITADVFRTYYTQLPLLEEGIFIVLLYFINGSLKN